MGLPEQFAHRARRLRSGSAKVSLSRRRQRKNNERGAMVVMSGLFLTLSISAGAVVVDLSNTRQVTRQSQVGADSAALAGAQRIISDTLVWSDVVDKVKLYATFNTKTDVSDWVNCTDDKAAEQLGDNVYFPDSVNNDSCISTDDRDNPTQLRVKIPNVEVETAFAGLFGTDTLDVSRAATAEISTGVGTKCIVCLLSDTDTSFSMGGAGSLFRVTHIGGESEAVDPGISVNSSSSQALTLKGAGGSIIAPETRIVGSYSTNGAGTSISPAPITGASRVSDPLILLPTPSNIAVPTPGSNTCSGSGSGGFTYAATGANVSLSGSSVNCTISPGLYISIKISGAGARLNMLPGTYVINGSFDASGAGTTIAGNGVTMFYGCSNYPTPCATGQAGGDFSISGAGVTLDLSPPVEGEYKGLTVFYDRKNSSSLTINGAGSSNFIGTIYAKSSDMKIAGAGSGSSQLNSMIIVSTLDIQGAGSQFNIVYDKAQNAPVVSTANLSK